VNELRESLFGERLPVLLDLFCGAGGAGKGYADAGFEVVGIDLLPQPRYPLEFHQGNALLVAQALAKHGYLVLTGRRLKTEFDAIHASPPCQAYSTATKRNGTAHLHPDLIGPVRELLMATGLPYVIENVVGAPLVDPELICGTERGLRAGGYRLRRHRLFETNWNFVSGGCGCDTPPIAPILDVSGGGPTKAPRRDNGGGRPYKGTADHVRQIMRMPWATKAECNEAIPPAYTEYVGRQLLAHIQSEMVANAA
jgi:DNA (cytosine-5)-methyltransferase 1